MGRHSGNKRPHRKAAKRLQREQAKKRQRGEDYLKQYDQPEGGAGEFHQGRHYSGGREHIQLVSDDLQMYVRELANQLTDGGLDEDSKEILVNNALEEFTGKEAQLCKDPVCSRAVQTLVDLFTTAQLINFVRSLSQGDEERITGIYIDPFASHVVERLFARIRSIMKEDPEAEVSAELLGSLEELCQCLRSERLVNIATHKYGSHVMRSLFVLLSGVEYPTTRSNKGWNKIFSFSIEKAITFAKYRTNKKLVHLKDALAQRYLDLPSQDIVRVAYDQYGSPVLQTFLQCTIGEDRGSQMIFKLLTTKNTRGDVGEAGGAVDSLCPKTFQSLAQHNFASHLLESVFISAEETIRSALYDRCVKGKLEAYATHHFANFVVQALVTCVTNKNVAKAVAEETFPLFGQLMRSNKGGVVAATLNMCSRLNVRTSRAFKAIEAVLSERAGGGQVDGETADLVLSLLTIERGGNAYRSHNGVIAVSKVGGTILCTLLKFPPDKCKHLMKAMRHLTADEIVQLTEDYLGIRVLEAFLDSAADGKLKQPLIGKLKGKFGAIAKVTHCSFFLEKCFKAADQALKEAIVEDLIAEKNAILQTYRGPGIFRTCAVELFQRSKRDWEMHLRRSDAVRNEFEEMFS